MSRRLWRYVCGVGGAVAAGILVATPAWAAGMDETRRRFGLGSALATVCCLAVVAVVLLGVLIGLAIGRRRRRQD